MFFLADSLILDGRSDLVKLPDGFISRLEVAWGTVRKGTVKALSLGVSATCDHLKDPQFGARCQGHA